MTVLDTVCVDEPAAAPLASPMFYTVAKPTDRTIAVPPSLSPLFPMQAYTPAKDTAMATIRGQANTVYDLDEYLDEPPPPASGTVEKDLINPKVIGSSTASEFDALAGTPSASMQAPNNSSPMDSTEINTADPLGYGVLLTVITITIIGLIYMIFVAYDYRQRWMQSQTAQNDRYLGNGIFDREMEDTYSDGSASRSDDLSLTRRSI